MVSILFERNLFGRSVLRHKHLISTGSPTLACSLALANLLSVIIYLPCRYGAMFKNRVIAVEDQ
jgi:hypothetical protein